MTRDTRLAIVEFAIRQMRNTLSEVRNDYAEVLPPHDRDRLRAAMHQLDDFGRPPESS